MGGAEGGRTPDVDGCIPIRDINSIHPYNSLHSPFNDEAVSVKRTLGDNLSSPACLPGDVC